MNLNPSHMTESVDFHSPDERVAELKAKLAARETSIEKFASSYLIASRENEELKTKILTLQNELTSLQAEQERRKDDWDFNMSVLFGGILKLCSEQDLVGDDVVVTKRLVETTPGSHEAAVAVWHTLRNLVNSWAGRMKRVRQGMSDFEREALAKLDVRIAYIAQHHEALKQLTINEMKDWWAVRHGRHRITCLQDEVIFQSGLASNALRSSFVALKRQSDGQILDGCIKIAYALVKQTEDLEHHLSRDCWYEVEASVNRTFYAVQSVIDRTAALSKRSYESSASAEVGGSSYSSLSYNDGDSYDDEPSWYGTDLGVNPANGMPMVGGIDVLGNPYGVDN